MTTVAGGMRGGSGMRDGVGVGALLNAPAGLAASASAAGAAVFLADAGSHALRAVSLAVAAKLTRAFIASVVWVCFPNADPACSGAS